ncbi:MAG: hypothetical protein HY929_07465 [Euryarchaeota archaeon]|nr:hypothetical protein [Euryarchaeota archaeon]
MPNTDWREVWWEKEKESLIRASEDLSKKEKFDVKSIFPDFMFEEPYGNWFSGVPVHFQLPFMKKIIVPLIPFRNQELFEKVYRLKLSEFAQLVRDEKIIPILVSDLDKYGSWFNKFFEEMELKEQRHIPPILRLSFILAGLKHGEEWSLFSKKVFEDVKKFKGSVSLRLQEIFKTFEIKEEVYEYLTNDISSLRLLGLDQVASAILSFNSIDDALQCACFSSLLTNPMFISLGGYTSRNREHFVELQKFFERLVPYAHPTSFVTCSRALVAEFKKTMDYSYPENCPPLEYVKKVEDIDEVKENFKVLIEIQKCSNRMDIKGAYDGAGRANEIIDKILAEINSRISTTYNFTDYTFALGFTSMTPIAALKLAETLSNASPLSFPLYNTSTEIEVIKGDLEGLAKWLAWAISGWNAAPYIIWKRESQI